MLTYIVPKRLIGDHVKHGARLVINSGHGVGVRRVVDPERGVDEWRDGQRKRKVDVIDAVAPAAVHRHVRRQVGRSQRVRPAKFVSFEKKNIFIFNDFFSAYYQQITINQCKNLI